MVINIENILSEISEDTHLNVDILNDFLKIKSISTIPEYANECMKAAEWLKNYLTEINLDTIIYESEGHPIVYSEYKSVISVCDSKKEVALDASSEIGDSLGLTLIVVVG